MQCWRIERSDQATLQERRQFSVQGAVAPAWDQNPISRIPEKSGRIKYCGRFDLHQGCGLRDRHTGSCLASAITGVAAEAKQKAPALSALSGGAEAFKSLVGELFRGRARAPYIKRSVGADRGAKLG